MDYSPWSSKNLIDRNELKKFMQVGIDVKFMYISFGGCGVSGFGDFFLFFQICPSDHELLVYVNRGCGLYKLPDWLINLKVISVGSTLVMIIVYHDLPSSRSDL